MVPSCPQLSWISPDPAEAVLGKEMERHMGLSRAQHHPPHPADTCPCTHLAGDVTWRLRRGENLFPPPVQRRSLSLRDLHSHRGHRFPGETTMAASPSPPLTCTLARTLCWEGEKDVSRLCISNNLLPGCRCLLKPSHLCLKKCYQMEEPTWNITSYF